MGDVSSVEYAHRARWRMVHGAIPDGLFIMHRCDNVRCVRLEHLKLGTPKDNSQDMSRKGRSARGERQGRSKLCPCAVRAMRRLRAEGLIVREIAQRFGVARDTAGKVCRGESWGHL